MRAARRASAAGRSLYRRKSGRGRPPFARRPLNSAADSFKGDYGADDIAAFRIGADGRAAFIGRSSAHGRGPRNFCLSPDGRFALIANQYSGNIAVCARDVASGLMGALVCSVDAPRAVCLALDGGKA